MTKTYPSIPNGHEQLQLLTSFPNDNSKHIDYVLDYKLHDEDEFDHKKSKKEKVRQAFLKALESSAFVIQRMEEKSKVGGATQVFVLLSCSTERLLQEAETIRLEMCLKNVTKNTKKIVFSCVLMTKP